MDRPKAKVPPPPPTSYFSPAELVPSVLETAGHARARLGRSPLDASHATRFVPGIASPVRRSDAYHPTGTSAHADMNGSAMVPGGPSESPRSTAASAVVGGATVVCAASALEALAKYEATTTAAQVVATAAELRRRRAEADKRAETNMVRAAVSQAACVTGRLSRADTEYVPSAGGRSHLYDRLGVAVAIPDEPLFARAAGNRSNSQQSKRSSDQHAGEHKPLGPIKVRRIAHDYAKWGLLNEERDFFKPTLRRPIRTMDTTKAALEARPRGDGPPAPSSSVMGGRPLSAISRRTCGDSLVETPLLLPVREVHRRRALNVHRPDQYDATAAAGLHCGSAQQPRMALADARHEAAMLLFAAERALHAGPPPGGGSAVD
jgi:hypothetical protein